MKPDKSYRYRVVDVFTSEPLAGNPLAVFPNARNLSTDLMQKIARELNLSETVFVLEPRDWDFAREQAAAIDAHWAQACAAKPGLAVLMNQVGTAPGCPAAQVHRAAPTPNVAIKSTPP